MPPRADGLSESELEAVAHPGGPLLILGGAGTGKSRVLCDRFTHLVEAGSPPGAVLSLALSTDAAARAREHVEAAIETPLAGAVRLTVGATFGDAASAAANRFSRPPDTTRPDQAPI